MANVRKRANGKWQLSVYKTDPHTGKSKRHYKTVEAINKYDAKKKAIIFEAKLESEFISYDNIYFSKYAQLWLDKKRKNLAPKTISNYTSKLNLHILPELGGIKLLNLKPIKFLDFYDKLQSEKNLSGKSVNVIHKVLHSMLSDAVRWEFLEYNVLDKVKAPKFKSRTDNFLSIEEGKNLLALIEKKEILMKYKLAIHIALFCGLRNGEIMGLEWKDFDFNNNIFEVKRASQYISNEGIITKIPKNETSIRKIHFNDSLKELFMEHKINNKELAETIPNWIETDRIFTTNKGGAIFPDTISKWFAKFLKRNNFSKKITFHGLRHTSATIMIYNGIDIQTIATRLGHADPTTTLKIYSHQIKKADKTAADKIFDTLK